MIHLLFFVYQTEVIILIPPTNKLIFQLAYLWVPHILLKKESESEMGVVGGGEEQRLMRLKGVKQARTPPKSSYFCRGDRNILNLLILTAKTRNVITSQHS